MLKTMNIGGQETVLLPENDADKVSLFALRYALYWGSADDIESVFNATKNTIDTLEDNTIVLMLRCFGYNSHPFKSALEHERDIRGLVDPKAPKA